MSAGDFTFSDTVSDTATDDSSEQGTDLGDFEDSSSEETEEEVVEDTEPDYNYTLHENVVEDLVMYSRSVQAKNEPQFVLTVLGYLTGLMENPHHYVSGVIIGTSSSGKTHMQDKVENLFPEDWLYNFTTGSDQTLAYDDEWDESRIASLDELNKVSEELTEILKSVHGGDEKFKRKVVQDWRNEEMKTLEREALPYWFLYAQFDSDFELWNRLLKIPVHEGGAKNEAVLKLQFDHHNIEFSDSPYTYDFEFSEGRRAIQDHINSLPNDSWVKLPAGEEKFDGFDVAAAVQSIFDTQRSETNRVAGMVANVIRSSALLNHHNREKTTLHIPNEGEKEVIVAEPEDVANVLACRDVLLASTHELDRKKQSICSAIDAQGGTQNMATIPDIVEYLRQGNAPIVSRTQVEKNLNQMIDHYLIEKYEGASEDGLNMYKFMGWHNIGAIRTDEEFQERFGGIQNPITGEDFLDSVERLNEDILPGASDFTQEASVQSDTGSSGQATLGASNNSIDLNPHEEAVRGAMEDAIDGETLESMDETEPSLYAMTGVTDLDHEPKDPDPEVEGTIFDPECGVWNRPDVNDNWVTNEKEAYDAVKSTMADLQKKGVFKMDVHETNDRTEPVKATVTVLGKDQL